VTLSGLLAVYFPPFLYYKFSRSSDYKNFLALRSGLAVLPGMFFLVGIEKYTNLYEVFSISRFWTNIICMIPIFFLSSFIIVRTGKRVDAKYEDLSKKAEK
jgi:hypothetical protein